MVQIRYDPAVVSRLTALPRRTYDETRTRWVVPPVPEAACALLAIVDDYNFAVSEHTLAELVRVGGLFKQIQSDPRLRSVNRYLYRSTDFGSLVSMPKDYGIAEEIKGLLGAVWDKRIGAYRLEATARTADMILEVAGEYDFFVEPGEYERLVSMGYVLFDEDDFTYDPLSSSDRVLYGLLVRLSKLRRENLFAAVRSYR